MFIYYFEVMSESMKNDFAKKDISGEYCINGMQLKKRKEIT